MGSSWVPNFLGRLGSSVLPGLPLASFQAVQVLRTYDFLMRPNMSPATTPARLDLLLTDR
jgi:hypothetical protein